MIFVYEVGQRYRIGPNRFDDFYGLRGPKHPDDSYYAALLRNMVLKARTIHGSQGNVPTKAPSTIQGTPATNRTIDVYVRPDLTLPTGLHVLE